VSVHYLQFPSTYLSQPKTVDELRLVLFRSMIVTPFSLPAVSGEGLSKYPQLTVRGDCANSSISRSTLGQI
jgi:hypothetical protein